MLISARVAMKEANKQSLEVAGLNPDVACELMNADAAEKTSFNKMENEILIRVNKFKSLYAQPSTTADHASGARRAATVNKIRSFKL